MFLLKIYLNFKIKYLIERNLSYKIKINIRIPSNIFVTWSIRVMKFTIGHSIISNTRYNSKISYISNTLCGTECFIVIKY